MIGRGLRHPNCARGLGRGVAPVQAAAKSNIIDKTAWTANDASVSYNAGTDTLTFSATPRQKYAQNVPSTPLKPNTTYVIAVSGFSMTSGSLNLAYGSAASPIAPGVNISPSSTFPRTFTTGADVGAGLLLLIAAQPSGQSGIFTGFSVTPQ
jgi:hypothetical protein